MTTGLNFTGKSVNAGAGVHGLVEGTIQDGYATAIGNGDLVTIVGGYVVICPETAVGTHVLRGVKWVDATGEVRTQKNYSASTTNTGNIDGNTEVVALLEPVQGRRFLIRATGTVNRATIGTLRRLTSTAPNAATGNSTVTVAMASAVTAELRLVRILGLAPTINAAFGTDSVLEVEVVDPDAVS
jgi:predicted RNA-binding protein with TRAM domain